MGVKKEVDVVAKAIGLLLPALIILYAYHAWAESVHHLAAVA